MKIKAGTWLLFVLLAVFGLGVWCRLEYPRFSFLEFPFDKQKAISTSEDYLRSRGVNAEIYSRAAVFGSDEGFNRYFQHARGIKAEEEFIKRYDYDLFYWLVRYFKESQKEEYLLYLSPRNGKVVKFLHLIKDTEPRPDLGKRFAQEKAEGFLRDSFGADLDSYDFHEEKIRRYENRVEYVFSWEKKGVYIPWKGGGGGKLLTEVTVSGDQVREFTRNKFDLPEGFTRYVQEQLVLGEYLYHIFYFIVFLLLAFSISIVLKKRQEILPRITKNWFYGLAGFLIIINTAGFFNNLESILIHYPTSAHLGSFLGLSFIKWMFNIGFLALGLILPGIAGETLCGEVFPEKQGISFISYLKTGFLNRAFSGSVILGYLIWLVMLGMQAVIFYYGQEFLGVWREWQVTAYFSSSYIPLFGAFVIAVSASLNEEIFFRLFGISLVKKYLNNFIFAILLTSLIWGLGHTMYAIFPVWFRVVEITMIGVFYGVIFIRFGIIPLIVAHYLFDVFWCSAVYLLGRGNPSLFYVSLGLLGWPLIFATAGYFLNIIKRERPVRQMLGPVQKFNLEVLKAFIAARKSAGINPAEAAEELRRNNWDYLLVKLAVEEFLKAWEENKVDNLP
ncbi:MAG: CPBP family glutamic-type intramembrane protease [Candidatus Omnitrophica bacterium]|jgi:membrane protease YdiL (CAAX protease family)|nr:CPBP family glutamic-type intramembrane protease [Candidatus Omnitrophota bacterium]MDD5078648.1 CPBP family glutamic-type intramembrane protease [Candidatus Omnitrophota bacterium]